MPRTGIFVAYDRNTFNDADQQLLKDIAPHIDGVKVGLQAMTAFHPDSRRMIAELVVEQCNDLWGLKVFWDMKLHDIADTVEQTIRNLDELGVHFFTLHAQISDAGLATAARLAGEYFMIELAVTVLTDLDDLECMNRFTDDAAGTAINSAKNLAAPRGIRGFVCSVHEVSAIRAALPNKELIIVTPGIRPAWYPSDNGHKRIATPQEAAQVGADYIVVGRPILDPPAGLSPVDAVRRIRMELDGMLDA